MSKPTTPAITFPPINDADGKPAHVFGVEFHAGNLDIEFTSDGNGAFLILQTDQGDADRKVEIDAAELTALGKWAELFCAAMDKHNGEGKAGGAK